MWNADLVLPGKRILLRAMREEDAPYIVQWRNRPDVKRCLYTQDDLTVQQHMNWYRTRVLTGQCAQFIIVAQETPVGTVFLKNIDATSHKAEYGIFIGDPGARGMGYGTEAARLILGYGFDTLGLNRVYLTVFSDNTSAIASYRHVGFREEGVMRQDFLRGDGYADVSMMSVLRQDWERM